MVVVVEERPELAEEVFEETWALDPASLLPDGVEAPHRLERQPARRECGTHPDRRLAIFFGSTPVLLQHASAPRDFRQRLAGVARVGSTCRARAAM